MGWRSLSRKKARRKRRGERKNPVEMAGDYTGMLDKPSFDQVALMSREIVHRYMEEELDAVYVVYNEFKSVMSQRVVVERILPIVEVGQHDIKQFEEMDKEEREEMIRAAATSGVSVSGQPTLPKPKRKPRTLALRKWITSTTSRRGSFWMACCGSTSPRRSITR